MDTTEFKANQFCKIDLIYIAVLAIVVSVIFGLRMTDRSLVGEEPRYGTAAREMIAAGDWLVFRQQGQVFAERPPLTIWSVAFVGLARGEVDVVAVRLASVISIVLTSLLLYVYVRSFASGFAAFSAGLIYPTMGQVLQIGRMGESEPFFGLLLSSSLMLWHLGYMKKWPAVLTWTFGFGFAALAALVKGPQAPIYFMAIVGVYLLLRRDWRFLFSWPTLFGGVVFVSIVAAWQVPYYLATDWESVVATWTGLAKDRIGTEGLFSHLIKYPLDTFVCLLPWGPFLFALIFRPARQRLSELSPVITFLVVALVVSYPTVWFAIGAKERYFLPLYPCIAAIIAIVIDRCASADLGTYPRRSWRQFQAGIGVIVGAAGIWFLAMGVFSFSWLESIHQPRWFAILFAFLSLTTCWICFQGFKYGSSKWNFASILAIGLFFGVVNLGIITNSDVARWNDPTTSVAKLKSHLPQSSEVVSLGPIDARFAWYYEDPIRQIAWPTAETPLPDNVDYFVFMRRPTDTPESRSAGRGRSWYRTPGTVPFEWEELTMINCDRVIREVEEETVVLGRVVRPLRAVVSDVTQPRKKTSTAKTKSPKIY